MRKRVFLKREDVLDDSFDEEEVKQAETYIGEYTLKTMSFGQKNEAQFKAIKVDINNPHLTVLDPWKFRFYSLLYSIEEAPHVGKRARDGYSPAKFATLYRFIYNAPDKAGEKLMDASDEVNKFEEEDRKKLLERRKKPSAAPTELVPE